MAKYAAFGTTLRIGGTAGTAVVNITGVDGPELSAEMLDMTAHDSAGTFRERIPTFLDAGELSFTIQYDPGHATHRNAAGGLLHLLTQRTVSSFAMGFPTTPAANWVFSGYVTKFKPAAPLDGALTAEVTITVSGAPTVP